MNEASAALWAYFMAPSKSLLEKKLSKAFERILARLPKAPPRPTGPPLPRRKRNPSPSHRRLSLKWQHDHLARYRAAQKAWVARNPEKVRQMKRDWSARNPEKKKLAQRRWRDRLKG